MPCASVIAVLTPTSDGLRASTVTPGRTAPDESLTTPSMEPRVSCASPTARHMESARTQTTIRIRNRIDSLLQSSRSRRLAEFQVLPRQAYDNDAYHVSPLVQPDRL